jgi:transposase InsO family protein
MLYHDLPRGRNRNGLLDKIVETAPFKISGTQADGGSEFKSVFEEEAKGAASNSSSCPPKARPQWLRRTRQSTWRYEFYAVYDLPHTIEKLQACADAFADHFNTQRPHEALAGLTPAEYLKSRSFDDPAKSHMY